MMSVTGVLFFLFLDKGVVVVERVVHLDFFFLLDPRFRGRGLLGAALRLGLSLFERDGLDLLRLGCGSLLRNWRARCDRGGLRPYRPSRHHDLIHRPAFWAVDRIFVQIVELSAATGAEPFGTQFGFRHGPILRAIWGLQLASRKAAVNSRSVAVEPGKSSRNSCSLEEAESEAQGAAKKPAPAEAGIEEEEEVEMDDCRVPTMIFRSRSQ